MKFLGQGLQKLEHEQDRQTDIQTDATERTTTPHWRVLLLWLFLNISGHLWFRKC